MTFRDETTWLIGFRPKLRRLAQLRARSLRSVGVAACAADGTGIRAMRKGAYTAGDLLLLADVVGSSVSSSHRDEAERLRLEVMPMTAADLAQLRHS